MTHHPFPALLILVGLPLAACNGAASSASGTALASPVAAASTAVATLASAGASTAPSPSPKVSAGASAGPTASPTAPATPSDPSLGTDGYTKPNFTFTPTKGQTFTIKVPGHGTEGYEWSIAPGYDTKVVSTTGSPRYDKLPPTAGVGASAAENFDFTAAGSGQTTLTLNLKRPWETTTPPDETRTFTVKVP